MRIIHSADWQIGKVFKQFGAKEETPATGASQV
jgi:hypothetical protein